MNVKIVIFSVIRPIHGDLNIVCAHESGCIDREIKIIANGGGITLEGPGEARRIGLDVGAVHIGQCRIRRVERPAGRMGCEAEHRQKARRREKKKHGGDSGNEESVMEEMFCAHGSEVGEPW